MTDHFISISLPVPSSRKALSTSMPAMVTRELMTMSFKEAKLILLSQLSPRAARCSEVLMNYT